MLLLPAPCYSYDVNTAVAENIYTFIDTYYVFFYTEVGAGNGSRYLPLLLITEDVNFTSDP